MRSPKRPAPLCRDTIALPFGQPANLAPATIRSTEVARSKDGDQHGRSTRHGCLEHEPLSVRIPTAVKLTGISRSRIYELIQSGDLETVKVGRSTLIPFRSLKELVRG